MNGENKVTRLFHGSGSRLEEGKVITASYPCAYYPHVVTELEAGRPSGTPSRSICLFAADTAVGATRFMLGQKIDPFWIYEVEMEGFQRAPFRITREIDLRLKAGRPVGNLVTEYWNPTANWFFNEYFGPSFEIIREVPAATIVELTVFDLRYGRDLNLATA